MCERTYHELYKIQMYPTIENNWILIFFCKFATARVLSIQGAILNIKMGSFGTMIKKTPLKKKKKKLWSVLFWTISNDKWSIKVSS